MDSRAVIEVRGRTLIIQRRDDARWLFPGGTVNPAESPWEALARALDEQFINCRIDNPLVALPNPEPLYLVKMNGVVVPNQRVLADARWVDPVAESQEYRLSPSIINSIVLLRKKIAEIVRPPQIFE